MENKQESGFNRKLALANGLVILKKFEDRLSAERFRPYETDNDFLKFTRGYAQLLQVLNAISHDEELEEIEQRIAELEAQAAKEGENVP